MSREWYSENDVIFRFSKKKKKEVVIIYEGNTCATWLRSGKIKRDIWPSIPMTRGYQEKFKSFMTINIFFHKIKETSL